MMKHPSEVKRTVARTFHICTNIYCKKGRSINVGEVYYQVKYGKDWAAFEYHKECLPENAEATHMNEEITLKNGSKIKVGAPPDPLDSKKCELYKQLTDTVLQHAHAKLPWSQKGEPPEQPPLGIADREQLYRELGNCIDIWGKSIISPARGSAGNLIANPPASGKTFDEEAGEEADRRAEEARGNDPATIIHLHKESCSAGKPAKSDEACKHEPSGLRCGFNHVDGEGQCEKCTCPDFVQRKEDEGEDCKHIEAVKEEIA